MPVVLRVSGREELKRLMKNRKGGLKKARKAHKMAAIVIFRWVQKNFRAEGGLHAKSSLKWSALKPATKLARVRKNLSRTGKGRNIRKRRGAVPILAGATPILDDTGRLKGSFQAKGTDKYARVFNAVKDPKKRKAYGYVHEHGSKKKTGRGSNIPQRKMLPTLGHASKMIMPVYERFVQEVIR